MAINWSGIGSTISGLTSALSSAGVSASSMPSLLQTIGTLVSSNPNQSTELAICAQILQFTGNPTILENLALKLATEQGIPVAAASLALTLANSGVDVPTRVLQIEQIIKNGS